MKTMFALLLIAGIALAAHAGPALAGGTADRAGAGPQDWWQQNFGRHLPAGSFVDVPWLDHVGATAGNAGRNGRPFWPRLDMLEPLRLQTARSPAETTGSGGFK
jgi:hypothetical protein